VKILTRVTTPNHRAQLGLEDLQQIWPHVGPDSLVCQDPSQDPAPRYILTRLNVLNPRKSWVMLPVSAVSRGDLSPSELFLQLPQFPISCPGFWPGQPNRPFPHALGSLDNEGGTNRTRLQIRHVGCWSPARTYSLHKPWRGFRSRSFTEGIPPTPQR
jgi:hypothetical protein